MKSIIEEMYHGRLCPLGERSTQSTEREKLVQKQLKAEKAFLEQYPECKEALEKLLSNYAELESCTAYEEFERGFRIGSQMMMEMLRPIE